MRSENQAVVAEVVLATLAVALLLGLGDWLAGAGGLAAAVGGLLAGGSLIVIPLVIAQVRKLQGDVLAVDPPLGRAAWAGLLLSLVILPPFAVGYDALQTRWLGAQRGHGLGLPSIGLQFQGDPPQPRDPRSATAVLLREGRDGLIIDNPLSQQVIVVSDHGRQPLPSGRRTLVPWQDLAGTRVTDVADRPAPLLAGAALEPVDQPIALRPDYRWLLTLVATQLAAIALPEELFFRGYVLGRLRSIWPARRRVLGVPFGRAHIVAAALFALIHLVTVPAPHRLLVFFPALLFGWLAERTRSAVAAAVHHALCNVVLLLLQRMYG